MYRSSKREDLPYSNSNCKIILIFQRVLVFFKFLLFKTKSGDDFYDIINQLQSNSKKMTLDEKDIFINLLKFGHKTVGDVMIPRSDIEAVKSNIGLEELNKMIMLQIPHTRTLVYDDTLDNIIGFVHIKDLFKVLVAKQKFQLKNILRKPIISAPSMKLIDLLAKMRKDRIHIAIVVDEYGGTDGIVTIEDIIERIVGRIDDEHDKKSDNNSFKILNNNTIISNARVEVEELEAVLGVRLKEENDEFDTIGGLVLAQVGNVPSVGTKINIMEQVELEVIEANPRALKQVKLKLKNGVLLSHNTSTSN